MKPYLTITLALLSLYSSPAIFQISINQSTTEVHYVVSR
jgi:hypothetical protein